MPSRSEMPDGWRQRQRARLIAIAGTIVAALLFAPQTVGAQTPVTAGFRDFSFGSSSTRPTGEKPESKLWWNDGSWWGSLYNPQAASHRIHRFDAAAQSWIDTGTALDPRPKSRADVLWDDATGRLYVASHYYSSDTGPAIQSQWSRLYRYTYDPAARTYAPDAGFPIVLTQSRVEALTIAKDSAGRLWITYVEGNRVLINHSLAHDGDWGAPAVLPVAASAVDVDDDDISGIIAFGGDRIGVMWSNQRTAATYFAWRRDSDPPAAWQAPEVVVPGAGCSGTTRCADDHINLKTDSAGRVFAAIKTAKRQADEPLLLLVVRDQSGAWDGYTVGVVADDHSRPIVLLDEQGGRVYAFYATEFGGSIFMKSSPLHPIEFAPGPGDLFIHSATDTLIDAPTSTRQNVNAATGVLVLAADSGTGFYLHNYFSLATAPALASFTPASGGIGTSVTLTGSGFTGTTAVSFNGVAAAFAVTSDTGIQTSVPAGASSGPIRVTTPAGTATSASSFVVDGGSTAPSITAFTPASGAPGTTVSIAGSGFSGATAVTFNGDGAVFTIVSATAIDAIVPAGATTGRIRVTTATGTATSATDFVVTGQSGSPIHAMTFEGGSLTDPATGPTRVAGTITLISSNTIKGGFSAKTTPEASSYLEQHFDPVADLHVSAYVRIDATPSSNPRIVQITNGGTTVGNVVLRSTGRLRLRVFDSGTVIGEDSPPMTPGQIYRIGLRQKRGSGGDAVLQAFLAEGDQPFGAPFAETTTGAWTTAADRVRVGATSGSAAPGLTIDNVRLDGALLPPPDSP